MTPLQSAVAELQLELIARDGGVRPGMVELKTAELLALIRAYEDGFTNGVEAGRRQGLEEAAKVIEEHQETSSNVMGKYLSRRHDGDVGGLIFAQAIRLLASTPDDPASRTEGGSDA